MTMNERLSALRTAMANAGVDAYMLPSSDPHASEYAPSHYTAWEYFSGFSSENSMLVVTQEEAALWVDGRFFGAADAALADGPVQSMHMGVKGVPKPEEWLIHKLGEGKTVGFTAANMQLGKYKELKEAFDKENIAMRSAFCDDEAWTEDRPALPATEVWMLKVKYAGKSVREKLTSFREKIGDCSGAVVTKLDSIAWLLNLRANDIGYTPYAIAFCYVTSDGAVLFIDGSRVPEEVKAELSLNDVSVQPYEAMPAFLKGISEKSKVLVDKKTINASFYNLLQENPACTVEEGEDPIQLLKAVKNDVELSCTREAHINDACAMVRFQIELEERLAAGETLRETDIGKMLYRYRSSDALFLEESFPTIAAYGSNAAMMHYAPVEGKDAALEKQGYLLVDCGGTYYNGTTDITRTYPLGPLTEKEKEMYTLTLRSHISLATMRFKEGTPGMQIDMIARAPFWRKLLDYRCGTGHGVSHVGAVHEGPQNLRTNKDNLVEFVPGMVITDEPGYYEEGVMGIRIENELVCVDCGESEYGHFYGFEPLMYVPISTVPVLREELSREELAWLNSYHEAVYEKLSPRLNEKECEWLREKTKAI